MPAQNTPYIIALLITSAICAAVVVGAWQRRSSMAALAFSGVMESVFIWSLGYALQLATASVRGQVLWTYAYFIGVVLVAPLWFVFAVQYTGYTRWLTRQNYILLSIVPSITLALIFTNERHHLMWQPFALADTAQLFSVEGERVGWFWVHTAYSYALLLAGTGLLLWAAFGRNQFFRGQMAALLVAVGAPFLANAVYLLGWSPWPIDLTPFAFTITGLALLWGLFRVQLFDVLPAARDAVLESMTDGVIVLDVRNRVIDINRAGEQFIRLTHPRLEKIIGEDVRTVLAAWPDLVEKYLKVSAGQFSVEIPSPRGNMFLEMRLSSLKDRQGRITGRVLVSSDVTASRRAERMQQAKEAAEASSQAKSAFLANMSHELRTPLNHILGFSELLREDALADGNAAQAADLEKITDAGKRLLNLISSVLEISRLDAGMVQLQVERFDPAMLAREAAEAARPGIEGNGNTFEVAISSGIGEMVSDSARLRQCLFNVLENAGKFTRAGAVTLQVERAPGGPQAEPVEALLFTVSDTGKGMTPAQVERLFTPFELGDASYTRSEEGAGLGLATTERLCRLLGGEIRVESEAGRGTTVSMRLPAVVKLAEAAA